MGYMAIIVPRTFACFAPIVILKNQRTVVEIKEESDKVLVVLA